MVPSMTIWPPRPEMLGRPAYRSLAQIISGAIAAGELRPGDRLPTHRDLAFQLGVSVQTVSRAYDALIRADVISGEVGRGTFVKPMQPEGRPPPYQRIDRDEPIIDCSMLTPVIGELHERAFAETLAKMAADMPAEALYSFRPRLTMERHAERGAEWLANCGLRTRPDLVLPTNGNTPAMTIALMTAANPGDLVVTEAKSHHTLKAQTRYLGLRIVGLRCDDEGIVPEAFDDACVRKSARILYVLPAGNGPRACVMGPERRAALVGIARRHDVAIIENDAWGPLEPGRPSPIAALAPERTFYFTGFTKSLLPGLRIAYLVVPEDQFTSALGRHMVTNWMATGMVAEVASRWIADGTADNLLQWQRRVLARRNRLAVTLLAGLPVRGGSYGLHRWLRLPEGWQEQAFVNAARQRGVAVAPGSAFDIAMDQPPELGVRICLGAPSEEALEEGLRTIARLTRNRPEPDFLTI